MTLYIFTKKGWHKGHRRKATFISTIFILSGLFLLLWVAYPILSFELFYAPRFSGLVRPIPAEVIKNTLAESIPQVLGAEDIDYTKASVWFPKAVALNKTSYSLQSYTLDIPKLKIDKANVLMGGEDLSKSLIQFTGPLPGNNGNSVILGHSTLLWFYNPKDYKSIFSKLPELKIGDEIYLTVDNVNYTYKIFEMKIVTPEDLSVLEQSYDYPYITLITCVPPGTYFKRLIVKGRIENIQ